MNFSSCTHTHVRKHCKWPAVLEEAALDAYRAGRGIAIDQLDGAPAQTLRVEKNEYTPKGEERVQRLRV